MAQDDHPGIPQARTGPIAWLSKPLRTAVEQTVSEYRRRPWKITDERDLSEFACHEVAIVSDGAYPVFFKYSKSADAPGQFEVELSGLQTLSSTGTVLIPQTIGVVPVENGCLLIMEALEMVERGPGQWKDIGTSLARIHRMKGNAHGLEKDGFWGPLHQDNTLEPNWLTFFRERRLRPLLKIAVDSGNLPSSVISDVENLIARLGELCGPEVIPSLLHGDAQQNNFVSTAEGAFVIDPAVFYGNPEWDLAMLDAWQPVPDVVFDSYRENMPIDSGFPERRDLWRLPLYLAAVSLEGEMHLKGLTEAVGKYL